MSQSKPLDNLHLFNAASITTETVCSWPQDHKVISWPSALPLPLLAVLKPRINTLNYLGRIELYIHQLRYDDPTKMSQSYWSDRGFPEPHSCPEEALPANGLNETLEQFKTRFTNVLRQMMYVSGETAEPPVETTSIIEDIVRQQVIELVSMPRLLSLTNP